MLNNVPVTIQYADSFGGWVRGAKAHKLLTEHWIDASLQHILISVFCLWPSYSTFKKTKQKNLTKYLTQNNKCGVLPKMFDVFIKKTNVLLKSETGILISWHNICHIGKLSYPFDFSSWYRFKKKMHTLQTWPLRTLKALYQIYY